MKKNIIAVILISRPTNYNQNSNHFYIIKEKVEKL